MPIFCADSSLFCLQNLAVGAGRAGDAGRYTEYQDVLTRKEHLTGASTEKEILAFLRYLCKIANRKKIFYLWRPWLKDPKDDMVLELAVAAKSEYIVTYNLKDFSNIQKFGIEAITPGRFLKILNEV